MNGGLVAIVAATGVNSVYAIRKGHSLHTVLIGGLVLAFFVSGMDAVSDDRLGSALAYTFLLGTVVYRSEELFAVTSGVLKAQPPAGGSSSVAA